MATFAAIKTGNDWTGTVAVADADGVAVNLTDATLKFRAAKKRGATATIEKDGVISDAESGIYTVTLEDTDTDVDPGTYICQTVITLGNGKIYTIEHGEMEIGKTIAGSS